MVNRKKTKRHKMIFTVVHRKHKIDLRGSTCGTCRVTLVTNPVLSHEWGLGLLLRHREHISCHWWQRYSVTVSQLQVMVATAKLSILLGALSAWTTTYLSW